MAKKFFPKALSVGLSLALCATMIAPAFAHVVTIDGVEGTKNVDTVQDGVNLIAESTSKKGTITMTEDEAGHNVKVTGGLDVTLDMDGCTLTGNSTDSVITVGEMVAAGDNVDDKKATLTIENGGTITGGNASGTGGGVEVKKGSTFTMTGGSIEGNTAKSGGGGIHAGSGSTVTLNDVDIKNNRADGYPSTSGGGIYVSGNGSSKSTLNITGGEISGNTANQSGGGIYTNYADATIKGVTITGNTSNSNGGGGIFSSNSTLTIGDSTISNNHAKSSGEGGGVYIHNSTATVSNSTVEGNDAYKGGGISAERGELTIEKSMISGNTAKDAGGGVYAGSGGTTTKDLPLTIKESTITENEVTWGASQGGGGVYMAQRKAEIIDSNIFNNTAKFNADDVYSSSSTLSLSDAGGKDADGNPIVGKDDKPITGWYSDVSGKRWKDGNYTQVTDFTGTLKLKAAHDEYFDVTFDLGYEGAESVTNSLEKGSDFPTPDTPTRKGFEFTGWVDGDGNKVENLPETVTGDVTLTAGWKEHAHTPGEAVRENEEGATCTTEGSYEEVFFCSECGKELSRETKTIEKLPHTPGEWEVVTPAQPGIPGEEHQLCTECGEELDTRVIAALPVLPYNPGEIEVNDPVTPLASGPVTRAQFIDYLWRHEGEPASTGVCTFTDVPAGHEFILALAWAEQNGIAEAYFDEAPHVDGTFEPDELVTAGAVREFLGNFETVFGRQAVLALDLTTLAVDDEEAVLNCDEVLAEFFGEEYVSPKDEDMEIAA